MSKATLDLSSSGSSVECKPIFWPSDGRAGSARIARRRLADAELLAREDLVSALLLSFDADL